ncbi:MAG: hypothetical protein KAS32_26460 [Candidatus Peribacteraceae bacterium]|nr:hypothetical protein [Candidatus Peribacteraceae bacterium]
MATIQERREFRRAFSVVLDSLGFDAMSRDIRKGKTMTKKQFTKYGGVIKYEIRRRPIAKKTQQKVISHTNKLIDRY